MDKKLENPFSKSNAAPVDLGLLSSPMTDKCSNAGRNFNQAVNKKQRVIMAILTLVLIGIGRIVALIGGIMFLIVAFQESVLWGIGCLLVPFVSLIFLVLHWAEAKKTFFIQLAGLALVFIGVLIGGHGHMPPPH
ncbi:MAG TPA: hypothetical protein VG754_06130 [Verrucomicrobiae bacterium]|nr:hypothetical protein [Verrucomicrobiae bacterium]